MNSKTKNYFSLIVNPETDKLFSYLINFYPFIKVENEESNLKLQQKEK